MHTMCIFSLLRLMTQYAFFEQKVILCVTHLGMWSFAMYSATPLLDQISFCLASARQVGLSYSHLIDGNNVLQSFVCFLRHWTVLSEPQSAQCLAFCTMKLRALASTCKWQHNLSRTHLCTSSANYEQLGCMKRRTERMDFIKHIYRNIHLRKKQTNVHIKSAVKCLTDQTVFHKTHLSRSQKCVKHLDKRGNDVLHIS